MSVARTTAVMVFALIGALQINKIRPTTSITTV